jgi:hypothetical protein
MKWGLAVLIFFLFIVAISSVVVLAGSSDFWVRCTSSCSNSICSGGSNTCCTPGQHLGANYYCCNVAGYYGWYTPACPPVTSSVIIYLGTSPSYGGTLCANIYCTSGSYFPVRFNVGDSVQLKATPNSGYAFDHFGNDGMGIPPIEPGDCVGGHCCYCSGGSCYFTFDVTAASGSLYAYFRCAPQCSGKNCGPDGCGGSCGTCTRPLETCSGDGVCTSCTGGVFSDTSSSCTDDYYFSSIDWPYFDCFYDDAYDRDRCSDECDSLYPGSVGILDASGYGYCWYACMSGGDYCWDCVCVDEKEGDVCGTTTCPSSGCCDTDYVQYPSSCIKNCTSGSCPSCSNCLPTSITACAPLCHCDNGVQDCGECDVDKGGNCPEPCSFCGDGTCDTGEDQSNCCDDCGCPSGQSCDGGVCRDICGNGVIDSGEKCELPNTNNNNNCIQATSSCDYSTRIYCSRPDGFGNCDSNCLCVNDIWSCGSAGDTNYCNNCAAHCGDGYCNCGETYASCPGDGCTYCADFSQTGIQSGTIWGVTVGITRQTTNGNTITFCGLAGTVNYNFDATVPGGTGTRYNCTSGCSGSVSSSTSRTASYGTQYRLIMQVSPAGSGTTNPSVGTYWNNSGASVPISASPNAGYVFSGWMGTGTNPGGEYTGPNNAAIVNMTEPITETAWFQPLQGLLVETRADVINLALDNVGITVDGTTQYSSGGSTTFSLLAASHVITAENPTNDRPFSHFWDHDSVADCNPDTLDTANNPYTFTMPSCAKTITAWYKVFTHFENSTGSTGTIDYDGTKVSGYLLREDGNPLHYAASVSLSYYDGSWNSLATVSASTVNGYFEYNWNCPGGVTQIRANFTPSSWYYVNSSGSKSVNCCYDVGLGNPVVIPPAPNASTRFNISCPVNGIYDCILPVYSNDFTDECEWSHWEGNNAIFNCSGLPVGSYIARCFASAGTGSNCCANNITTAYNVYFDECNSDAGCDDDNICTIDTCEDPFDPDSVCTYEDVIEAEIYGNCDDLLDNDCDGKIDSEDYPDCPRNSMNFTGTLNYSTGMPVSNSLIKVTISNDSYVKSGYNETDDTGQFFVTVRNIPSPLMNSDFDLSIYVVGEVEAIYECRYDSTPGVEFCNPV